MIPEFGKPLPAPASNRGSGGQAWTAGTRGPAARGGGSDEERVGRLEQTAFGSTYPEHDVADRVDHLEKEVFGSRGTGSLKERIVRLEKRLTGGSAFGNGAFGGSKSGDKPEGASLARASSAPVGQVFPEGNKADTSGGAAPDDGAPAELSQEPQLSHKTAAEVVEALPYDKKAGDYFKELHLFEGDRAARWDSFPVRVRLPESSPDVWKESLQEGVDLWGQYIPLRVARRNESADIEVSWVNHLVPRVLGVTRLTVFGGRMKVNIYLLRPSYYQPGVSEKSLVGVIEHELGHALGIFGHSREKGDTMYEFVILPGKGGKLSQTKFGSLSSRDVNTLKRIYEKKPLPDGFSTSNPMEWSSTALN